MNKFITFFFVFLSLTISVSCTTDKDKSDDGSDIVIQPYFCGQVMEKYETSCLMEVTDPGNQYFRKGDLTVVNTNIDGCPQYGVGDYLRIIYDGMVAESYPPQIFHVFSIHKTDVQGIDIN